MRAFSIILPFVFILSGCQVEQDSAQEEVSSELSEQATAAIEDLSGRLGVVPGDIELVREESVTWRNGSLGCPKEGMMYTQALVEGSLIVLRVDGKNYPYHSGKGHAPFLCENPEKSAAKAKSSLE